MQTVDHRAVAEPLGRRLDALDAQTFTVVADEEPGAGRDVVAEVWEVAPGCLWWSYGLPTFSSPPHTSLPIDLNFPMLS